MSTDGTDCCCFNRKLANGGTTDKPEMFVDEGTGGGQYIGGEIPCPCDVTGGQ